MPKFFVENFLLSIVLYCVMTSITALFTDYAISHLLVFFEKPDTFTYWHAYLVSLVPFIGQITVPMAVLIFILSFFIAI